jgi:type IX secretion system PorP/SprF family membrane protein
MNRNSFLGIFFKAAVIACFFVVSGAAFGQQDPQFTQYMYSGTFYNPAFAGKELGTHFSALHRTQWQGYTTSLGSGGAPSTQLITVQGRLKSKNIGYGLTIVNDQIGAASTMEINLQGSYHKKIKRTQLSFGGYVGMSSSSLDYGELVLINPEPGLPQSGTESQLAVDVGAGVILDRGGFYAGLSARHLNQPSFDFGDGSYANRLQMHNYLLLGYRLRPIGQLRIEPSILLKTIGGHTLSYDASVIATLQNRINAGVAYRGEESVSLILGYSLLKDNSLKLGYAFDLVVGGLEAKAPTSHEILLRYAWSDVQKSVNRVIQRTPRFRF